MAIVSEQSKDVLFKIVYCGPAYGGKTSNISAIQSGLGPTPGGDLVSLATSADRILYFEFIPPSPVVISGYNVRFQLYTCPGRVRYGATRQLVLRGADGVVFVADSDPERVDDNLKAFQMLQVNMQQNRTHLAAVPWVMQYNKRDLPNAIRTDAVDNALGLVGVKVPRFEACACSGENVLSTLDGLSQLVLRRFQKKSQAPVRKRRLSINPQLAAADAW